MTRQSRIDLPEEDAARLASLAVFRDTTPEQLLAQVAQGLLADAQALEARINEGEADIEADRTVSFDEATAEMDAIIAKARTARS